MPVSPTAPAVRRAASQSLKSPTTLTSLAFGAHTAKRTPPSTTCAPSFSYSCSCRPARASQMSISPKPRRALCHAGIPLRASARCRRPGSAPTRVGCSARSGARTPPSRARRPRAACRARSGRDEPRVDRRRGSRRGTPRARASPTRAPARSRAGSTAPTRRRRTSAASRRRRAAGCACAAARRATARARPRSRGSPSRRPAHSVCPRWKSPWCESRGRSTPTCVSSRKRSRTSSPRPRIGVERLDVLGQLEEDALDLLVDRRREEPERLGRRLLRARSWVGRSEPSTRVHRARHLAEPVQAREEALAAASLDIVERELPAVDPAGDELLQDPERRVDRLAGYAYQPRAARCSRSRAR